jgi:hypothetical protein
MKQAKLTIANLQKAIVHNNDTYIQRTKPEDVKLCPNGMNEDINQALKTLESITEQQLDRINALGIESDFIKLYKDARLKTVKRMVQVLAVLGGADASKHLATSSRAFFLVVGAICCAGATTRDGIAFAVTGKGNENTSDGVQLVAARQLQKIGCGNINNLSTEYSNSVKMIEMLKIGHSGGKNKPPIIDKEHVITRAVVQRIAAMTDIELQDIAPKTK